MKLPRELVEGWKQLAQSRGMTMRGLQMLVMKNVLGHETSAPTPSADHVETGTDRNLRLRLLPGEQLAVRSAAAEEGHSIMGWIAMVIRARLKQAPIQTQDEIRALNEASFQLMAVGRNLNSILRRLNQDEKWTSQTQLLTALLKHVRQVEEQVHELQRAGERRGAF
ncbi:hypothetical protein KWH45_21115 [Xanthomonas campestris pv. mirabilis]|uniref:hypothetical protein n=1 Tax=Xanthomonas euvesicatoria TaxID=456327 RepID=UPI001C484A8F|nr:hypothetical protein [Xanthomonas euvesicatoria]MBV6855915.1 hypothetical protein [Xanthomonas campestris pv. mirabilis]